MPAKQSEDSMSGTPTPTDLDTQPLARKPWQTPTVIEAVTDDTSVKDNLATELNYYGPQS